ncbi:PilN domain-containing protein [Pseudomonas sp. Marseille-Q5299]|uniref:PilN domain-containing protein n=1 Tax=Pseudomonas sp. Marseille-Q5299 TaxID=2942201 RepID=UPI0020738D85|nr:PilN domain-containing protein [Pseudomonas sp. Marseille-Q5299]
MPRYALVKVLAHEIDRYTPLTSTEVYFAVQVLGGVPVGPTMDARLTVMPRSRLDGIVRKALELGVDVASVDVVDSQGRPQGIDLLPTSVSVQRDKRTRTVRNGLVASALILLLACMSAWVQRSEQALEARRAQLADIRANALQVDAMRKQLQARSEVERALRLRETQRLGSVALLDLLTRCVPEQAWLDSLRVGAEGQLVLTGTSSRASDLPAYMSECAGLLKAGLQGGIQPEPGTGRERFTLHARLPGGE